MKLLKELATGDLQNNLKSSDKTDAGSKDIDTGDIKFSLMRNALNSNATGSDINNYLEKAHSLNDEVDTVGFAIQTDNGDLIKVYVNAAEADAFEEECSTLLGVDGDFETAINNLAQKYDIVDIEWPQAPNDAAVDSPNDDDVSLDDLSAFMDDDDEVDALPADDEDADDEKPAKKTPLLKDVSTKADDVSKSSNTEVDDSDISSEDDAESDEESDEESEKKSKDDANVPSDEDETAGPVTVDDKSDDDKSDDDKSDDEKKVKSKAKKAKSSLLKDVSSKKDTGTESDEE